MVEIERNECCVEVRGRLRVTQPSHAVRVVKDSLRQGPEGRLKSVDAPDGSD
jgi:hypothetical protein